MTIKHILNEFSNKKILVFGDLMIDEYIFGHVERISPEAPVPVVEAMNKSVKLGGAANVAENLKSLGCDVSIIGVIGEDVNGSTLKDMLENIGVNTNWLIIDHKRPTTIKTRIIAGSQHIVRVDWESKEELAGGALNKSLSILESNFPGFDAVIISDYGKGVVTKELFRITGKIKNSGTIVSLDPKERNFSIYRDITVVTPNIKESFFATGIKPNTDKKAEKAGSMLVKRLQSEFALITRGEQGLSIIGKNITKHIPAKAKQVYDVTGAGDTVVSVFTLSLCCGASPVEAAELANAAAGVVVGKLGAASVNIQEILDSVSGHG